MEKYPGITSAQEAWKDEVFATKALRTASGLIFYWPDTDYTRSGYLLNSTNICNYPVQSLATADIIPVAITYLWHRMKDAGLESFIVNTIHDSGITETNPKEKEKVRELFEESFVKDVYAYLMRIYNIDFNVPLAVDIEFKQYWGK